MPKTSSIFNILYLISSEYFTRFDIGVGAQVTIGISSFVSFIFMYTIAFGLSFEIPVFMVGLSRFGIVTADTWKKNWRYAGIILERLYYHMDREKETKTCVQAMKYIEF